MLDIKLKLRPGHISERPWMAPMPLKNLFWNVTYACNFRCKICFTDAGDIHPNELTTREALEAVDNAHVSGVKGIIISGGEPFMRKDIVDILAYMAKRNITARIASNGSLLSDELLGRLANETKTKSFQISVDTLNSDLFDQIHGTHSGMLQKVLDGLRLIQKHGFHTTVSVRLAPETLSGIPQLLDKAHAEGWATVTIHLPLHTRRIESAFPQDADVISLLKPVFKHFVSLPEHWLAETYIPWAQYHPAFKELGKHVRVTHRGCVAGRDRLTINPAGDLSPCVCLDVPEAYVGNVRKDNLKEVFENAPLCKLFRAPHEYGLCVDCSYVLTCGAGCRASAFALTGKLDGLDLSCPLRRRRIHREALASEKP